MLLLAQRKVVFVHYPMHVLLHSHSHSIDAELVDMKPLPVQTKSFTTAVAVSCFKPSNRQKQDEGAFTLKYRCRHRS